MRPPLPWASFSFPRLGAPWVSVYSPRARPRWATADWPRPIHGKKTLTLVSSGQSNYEQSKTLCDTTAAGKDPHHVGFRNRAHADSAGAPDHREKQRQSESGTGGHQAP